MGWVYAVAFVNERFIMVFNPKRNGWEMPGGRIEAGEEPDEAVVREFQEECGCIFTPLACREHRGGTVFVGMAQLYCQKAEMDWILFSTLPENLAFPDEDYEMIIDWARSKMDEITHAKPF